jgi:hypothetical protein
MCRNKLHPYLLGGGQRSESLIHRLSGVEAPFQYSDMSTIRLKDSETARLERHPPEDPLSSF